VPRLRRAARARAVDAELDLTGLACPETFRRTRRRLEDLAPGATLRVVLSSDESSRVVPASLAAAGHHVRARGVVDGRHVLLVERAADPEAP
jgi:TusA-related sulfurtransferase